MRFRVINNDVVVIMGGAEQKGIALLVQSDLPLSALDKPRLDYVVSFLDLVGGG